MRCVKQIISYSLLKESNSRLPEHRLRFLSGFGGVFCTGATCQAPVMGIKVGLFGLINSAIFKPAVRIFVITHFRAFYYRVTQNTLKHKKKIELLANIKMSNPSVDI